MEKTYNNQEKSILTAIYSAEKPLSTEAIAKMANMSRITAKKYLEELEGKGKVESERSGKAIYWWLRVKERLRV